MNLIVKDFGFRNGHAEILFEYEKEDCPRLESTDILKLGIENKKKKIEFIMEGIVPNVTDNLLTFDLNENIIDFFFSTDAELAVVFIESTKENVCEEESENDDSESESTAIISRYYIKYNELTQKYFCNYSSSIRLYFSKIGLLSVDAKKNRTDSNEKLVFIENDSFEINNGELSINVPYEEDLVEKCEVIIADASDYNNIYKKVIEKYYLRYATFISDGIVKINLAEITTKYNVKNKWFSVQLLIKLKGQVDNTRIVIGIKSCRNGHSFYDLRKKGYKVSEIANVGQSKLLQADSKIGCIFALSEKSFIWNPLCSARLMDSRMVCGKIALLIYCSGQNDDYKGLIIEDSLGNKSFIKYDYIINGLMLVTIDVNSIDIDLKSGDLRVYVLNEENGYSWIIPVVVKEKDENKFNSLNIKNLRGTNFALKIGKMNEIRLEAKVSNALNLDNAIEGKHAETDFSEWINFPKCKGKFPAVIDISGKVFNFSLNNNFVSKYINEISVIIRPGKPQNANDYLLIEDIKKLQNNEYSFELSREDINFIFENNICRFYVYLKTAFYSYYFPLFGIDRKHTVNARSFFDRRDFFFESVYSLVDSEIEYEIQPYYSSNGHLAIRTVRTEDIFKGQMSAQIDDVSIEDGILMVEACLKKVKQGEYTGLCISYRNRTEDDAVKIFSNDVIITECEDHFHFSAKLNLKENTLDGITWDILVVYTLDDKNYFLNMFQKDDSLRTKFRNPYNTDVYRYEDGTFVFPYCTYGNTVALLHREYEEQYDTVEFRLQEEKAIELYNEKKEYYDSQNIILIFEKYGTCSDNAYHVFKYCMEHDCEKKINAHIYYIIGKDSVDYKNVSMYEDHLVEYGSIEHQIYILAARLFVSSDTNANAYIVRIRDSYIAEQTRKKKYVFIDHGIAALKNGDYIYGKGTQGEPTWYTVSSDFTKGLINKYYKLSNDQLKVTGLARWDVLEDRSNGKKKILIAPTWRRTLDEVSDEKFLQSTFCQRYLELLRSPRFVKILEDNDIECDFYMHLKFIDYLDTLKGDDSEQQLSPRINVCSFGEKAINDFYMECSMMITDYSSVAFDTLWQNKPVVFYQFDFEDFNQQWGSMIDLDTELPGDLVDNLDGLLDLIEEYVDNDFCMKKIYLEKANMYFKYKDHSNCKRIWKVIENNFDKVKYKEPSRKKSKINTKKSTETSKGTVNNSVVYRDVNTYLNDASEGRIGLKTILKMIPRWLGYKLRRK